MHHQWIGEHKPARTEKPMYWEYKRRKVGILDYIIMSLHEHGAALRDESIDIHELNAEDSESSSSEETVVHRMSNNGTANPVASIQQSQELEDEAEDNVDKGLNRVRAHWIQLYKVNVQSAIIQQMFVNMLDNHPQTRPIWQFSRKINTEDTDWPIELGKNIQFRHHCASIQAAFTMIMDNLDDSHGLTKLLQGLGEHHFFYDSYEPHFELMHEGFMEALKKLLDNTNEYPDTGLCREWNELWGIIKVNIEKGISNQRRNYLIQCVTTTEMNSVRKTWEQVRLFGLENCATIVTRTALKTYNELITRYKINLSVNIDEHGEVFQTFALEVIQALQITIDYYTTDRGFEELPHVLKEFVSNCIVIDVCPTLVRKAFMEGLISMLGQVIGESATTESVVHLWNKIYRVLEQAILTNILAY